MNKEDCTFSATILLDDSTHGIITSRTVVFLNRHNRFLKEWQEYFEDKSLYCIVSLMKGVKPKCWGEISKDAEDSIRSGVNVEGILYLLLRNNKIARAYNDDNFLRNMERRYGEGIRSQMIFNNNDFEAWLDSGGTITYLDGEWPTS